MLLFDETSHTYSYDPAFDRSEEKGKETAYVETWKFTDDTHYAWKLLRKTPEGLQEEMGGTYTRK